MRWRAGSPARSRGRVGPRSEARPDERRAGRSREVNECRRRQQRGPHPRRHGDEAVRRGGRPCGDQTRAPAGRHRRGRWRDVLHPFMSARCSILSTTVSAAWRTFIEVGVRVEAENPFTGESHHTSSAYPTRSRSATGDGPPRSPRSSQSPGQRDVANGRHSCGAPTVWPSATRSSRSGDDRRGHDRAPSGAMSTLSPAT